MTKIQELFKAYGGDLTVGLARQIIRSEKLTNEVDAVIALNVFTGDKMEGGRETPEERLSSLKEAHRLFTFVRKQAISRGETDPSPSEGALEMMAQEIEIIETAMMMLQPKTLN